MANDAVQVKFQADTGELIAAMQQVQSTVSGAIQGMAQNCGQLAQATKQSNDQIVQSNKSIENSVSSLHQRVTSSFRSMHSDVQSSMSRISSAISSFTGVFASLGALAAGGGMFNAAISASQRWTSEVVALSKALGITTERASGLNMALRLNGLESNEYIAMSMRMLMAIRSNGDELERQGLQWRRAGNDQAAMFQEALRWINEATSGVDKNSRAMQVFGRGTMEAAKFQKLTNEALEEGTKRAQTHNMVVGQDGVEAYKKQSKQLNELKQNLDEVQVIIGQTVLPMFIDFGKWLTGAGKTAVTGFTSALGQLGRMFAWVGEQQEKWHKMQNAKLAKIFADDMARAERGMERIHQATRGIVILPMPQPTQEQEKPSGELTLYSAADFDRTLKDIKNEQSNWYTWSAEQELGFRKQSYEWAVQYYGAESQVAKDLWDKYSDAARAANREAAKGSGGTGKSAGGGGLSESGQFKEQLELEVEEARAAGTDTKRYELEKWNERLATLKRGSNEYLQALREVNRLAREIAQQDATAAEQRARRDEQIYEIQAQSATEHEESMYAMKKAALDHQVQLGETSEQEALRIEQQFLDARYQAQLADLQRRIELMKTDPNLDPAKLEATYAKMRQITDRYWQESQQLANKSASQSKTAWQSIGSQISSTLGGALTSILSKTQSTTQALRNLWNTVASNMINSVLKATLQFVLGENTKTAAASYGATARDGIQDASAAKGLATQAATATKSIFNDAKKGAAAAYSALAGIPYIGPVLGAAAAAVVFAAIMTFGSGLISAEGGCGEVPSDQLALVHKREMVLPAPIAETIRSAMNPVQMMRESLAATFSSMGAVISGSPSQRDGARQKELVAALQAIGLRGIPDDKLTFLRGVSQQGPAYLAAQMGAGGGAAALAAMAGATKNSSSVSSSRMSVYKPTFNFPVDLAGAVKRNPDVLYKGVQHAMRHGHIRKKR